MGKRKNTIHNHGIRQERGRKLDLKIDHDNFLKMAKEKKGSDAAQLLLLLGIDEAAQVLGKLSMEEVELLARQIVSIRRIDAIEAKAILENFGRQFERIDPRRVKGGVDVARQILTEAFGDAKASEILSKTAPESSSTPFAFLNKLTFDQLAGILKKENPRVLALVMSYINRTYALKLLRILPDDMKSDVILFMARPRKISHDVLATVEDALRSKLRYLDSRMEESEGSSGGVLDGQSALADMLKYMDFEDERRLLEELDLADVNLGKQIRRKLYTMDSIMNIRDRDLQDILQGMSEREIAILLKGQSQKVRDRLFGAVSQQRRLLVVEELDLLPPMAKSDIDASIYDFVERIRKGEDEGTYVVIREGELDEYI